ncbi:MAG: hypothetical protein II131_01900, partial [Neisseriaceae bacterium]|nr:hypothetical protein [Neisseriaceae bacterium]
IIHNLIMDIKYTLSIEQLNCFIKSKEYIHFSVYLFPIIIKSLCKYVFFAVHIFLLYSIAIRSYPAIRQLSIFCIFAFLFLFLPVILTKRVRNKLNIVYFILLGVGGFLVSGSISEKNELIIQEKEEIVSHYLSQCQEKCDKRFYFTKGIFEQMYVARIYNLDDEKCVSISNNYFDPNLYISKCGNKEIEVNYLGKSYNN